MKTLKSVVLSVVALLCTLTITLAQNYKAAEIDASGKITDQRGKHIGSITKEGVINDAKGVKVAYVDSEGTLVDATTGKKLGKTEKNGNFLPAFAKTPDEGWSVSTPMNGTCLVKDKEGNVKAEVHENYKAFGACAIHCLSHHMDHHKVLDDQQTAGANYSCPMHPDVTSDKSGKCSKCGMALEKKDKN